MAELHATATKDINRATPRSTLRLEGLNLSILIPILNNLLTSYSPATAFPQDHTLQLISLASGIQLPLQNTPMATCLNGLWVREWIKPQSYCVEKEFTESAQEYMSRANLSVKVLDFVQLGGFYWPLILTSG